jgi:hypothetical protein
MPSPAHRWVLAALLHGAGSAAADEVPAPAPVTWELGASIYGYDVPDDDYWLPTVTADRGWLHLEARYNYEEIDTGSAWGGYNFSGGEALPWEVTPMLGLVFGDLTGIAPGYTGSVGWRKLELYSEGEYVVDESDSTNNFFYSWSELSLAPVDRFWFGVVTQRTRAYETERDIQRGLLVGGSIGVVDLTAYWFNPDDEEPTLVFAVELGF